MGYHEKHCVSQGHFFLMVNALLESQYMEKGAFRLPHYGPDLTFARKTLSLDAPMLTKQHVSQLTSFSEGVLLCQQKNTFLITC